MRLQLDRAHYRAALIAQWPALGTPRCRAWVREFWSALPLSRLTKDQSRSSGSSSRRVPMNSPESASNRNRSLCRLGLGQGPRVGFAVEPAMGVEAKLTEEVGGEALALACGKV